MGCRYCDWKEFLLILCLATGIGWLVFRPHNDIHQALTPNRERVKLDGLTLPQLNGRTWRLSDHRGNVVVLNFWTSWCPLCREETHRLVDLAKEYSSNDVQIATVSLDEGGEESIRRFVQEFGIPFPVLVPDLNSPETAHIRSLPATILVDRSGRIAKTYSGAIDQGELRRDVKALLSERRGGT